MGQPAGEAGDRPWAAGAGLAFQVGDEGALQPRVGCRDAVGKCGRLLPVGRCVGEDVEVEQHPVGRSDRHPIVTPSLPGVGLSGPARLGQGVKVLQM